MKVRLNLDEALVKEIKDKLKANDGFCPCRIQKTENNKCMCKEFKDMITEDKAGMCHCGLYIYE